MGMSDFLEASLRTHIFRTGSYTKPAALGISLHTGDPTDVTATANANEVANAGAYARVSKPPLDANWSIGTATDGIITNTAAITFPAPTLSWGTVTHVAIYDSIAYGGGNLLFSGALTTSKVINNGDAAPSFAIGTLVITFT